MSQLKFWNKQNNNNSNKNDLNNSNSNAECNGSNSTKDDAKNGKRNWLHAPDALVNGHIAYLVKFFGNLPVEQAKGIEVVKDAIRKLQFAQQMKKAETGTQEKFKKVEITISVDGVAVQEPRTQKILHQFPLHNISYCADEKGVKKFFSFIAKTTKSTTTTTTQDGSISSNGSTNAEDTHECFVFISNKLASDITLTIGQAFDLAYRKYINNAEKSDLGKAQQQIVELEKTISIYKNRLREVSLKLPKSDLDSILFKMGIKDLLEVPPSVVIDNGALTNGKLNHEDKLLIDTNSSSHSSKSSQSGMSYVPIVPPRNTTSSQKSNGGGQKMEELLLNSDTDSDFDPRADETLDSKDIVSNGKADTSNDLFGFEPSKSYGQQLFYNNSNSSSNNNNNDHKLLNNNNNNSNGNNNNSINNHFTNEINLVTPPLLAPPPKMAVPRRSTSVTTPNYNFTTDLFGSDPFDSLNGPIIGNKNKLGQVSIDDFSLESLDPLRK